MTPRAGTMLQVLIVARISTVHQDVKSLADQIALCEYWVRREYSGQVKFTHIQGQGSGEHLDREDFVKAEDAVASGHYDLVVVEDLARICRRNRAMLFCEEAEDAGTRLVAINDQVDTAAENWRLNAFFATFKHEMSNKDTSARIRRTLANRFDQGGVVQTIMYGYIKPLGTKSDADVRKDPEAEPVIAEIVRRLEDGASFAEVADWLNEKHVPTGKWVRTKKWTDGLVQKLVRNPLLKGVRIRNKKVSKRVNKTGRHRSVDAPKSEWRIRHCPHLAFVDAERFDRLQILLEQRTSYMKHGKREQPWKKLTAWPGQHGVCGVCGRPYHWGGHGEMGHLMCSGARKYQCWNGSTFHGQKAGERIVAAVLAEIERLPDFDAELRGRVEAAVARRRSGHGERVRKVDAELADAERRLACYLDSLGDMGSSPALRERILEAEARKRDLELEKAELARGPVGMPELPPIEELRAKAREAVGRLDFGDPAYGRTMRRLIPRFVVSPYVPRDGGHTVLRAHLSLDLVPLLGDPAAPLGTVLRRDLVVDLFDQPQRIAIRERAVGLLAAGTKQRDVAAALGVTQPAVQNAVRLDRLMREAGRDDPYVPLTDPADGSTKMARHRHNRYRFEPLPGFPVGKEVPSE